MDAGVREGSGVCDGLKGDASRASDDEERARGDVSRVTGDLAVAPRPAALGREPGARDFEGQRRAGIGAGAGREAAAGCSRSRDKWCGD